MATEEVIAKDTQLNVTEEDAALLTVLQSVLEAFVLPSAQVTE